MHTWWSVMQLLFELSCTVKQGQHERLWSHLTSHAAVFKGVLYAEEGNDSLKVLKNNCIEGYVFTGRKNDRA